MGSGGGSKYKKGEFREGANSWAPWTEGEAVTQDIERIEQVIDNEQEAQERLRKQQMQVLQVERAKRSNISTKTKRNTIKTGAQGITNKRQSMPSTIAGGSISDMPDSGSGTIIGG